MPIGDASHAPIRNFIGQALTLGLSVAVVMWVIAWISHFPGLRVPPELGLLALIAAKLVGLGFGARRIRTPRPILLGLCAGLIVGLVNLKWVGSLIVDQPESTDELVANSLRDGAALAVAAYTGTSVVLGLIAGCIAKALPRRTNNAQPASTPADWFARLAAVVALAFVPIIIVGGSVTSTESGMAVPDPVTSYGTNPILFPLSLMAGETGDPRVYFEHSHRLFGWMVGVSTLTLAIYGLFAAPKLWLMAMPWVLGVLVVVQAIFGIIRVGDNLAALGAVHGVTAQLVFAFAVAIAVMAHRSWRETLTGPRQWRGRSTLGAVLLGAFVLQLAMGALFRHLRRGDEGGAAHAMYSHAVFSFVVVVLCVAFGAIMVKGSRETSIAGLKRIGYGLMHGVGLQFILGWAALAAILLADDRGNVPTADQLATAAVVPWWEAFVATVHQANGALLLCLATVGTVWAFRLAPRTAKAHVPTASSAAPA